MQIISWRCTQIQPQLEELISDLMLVLQNTYVQTLGDVLSINFKQYFYIAISITTYK